MVEFLTAVALMFTQQPVTVHCPSPWEWGNHVAGVVVYPAQLGGEHDLYMPRATCRDLRRPRPWYEHINTFTHELVHVRFPYVKHGQQMNRAVAHYRKEVCRLLHVRCTVMNPDHVRPEPWPG